MVTVTMLGTIGNLFDSKDLVPLAIAIMAVVLLMSSLRRRQRRLANPSKRPAPQRDRVTDLNADQTRRDLDRLLVELEELARRISAEIDTRFAKLETAIHDADQRIAVLQKLKAQDGPDRAQASVSVARSDDRHAVVYEMADAGASPIEIAKELGRSPGEVELVLNLRRGAESYPTSSRS